MERIAEFSYKFLEILGIIIIVTVSIYATLKAVYKLSKRVNTTEIYKEYRQQLARGILLGLEFLVGSDIIQTVAIDLTLEHVGILAAIILIRSFLSFTLELDISGKWPWQKSGPS